MTYDERKREVILDATKDLYYAFINDEPAESFINDAVLRLKAIEYEEFKEKHRTMWKVGLDYPVVPEGRK